MNHNITYKQQSWSLDHLFSGYNDPEIEQTRSEIEEDLIRFESMRDLLVDNIDPEEFIEIIKLNEQITKKFFRLYGFGSLKFASDTQDQRAQTFLADVGQLRAEAGNRTLFFSLWWKGLTDDAVEKLLYYAGDLRYWLEKIRSARPHTLSEAEEKIVNLKNVNGRSAMDQLYDSITNRYEFVVIIDGVEQRLTRAQLAVHYRSENPNHREAAYKALFDVYSQDAPILGQIYQFMMRDWRSEYVSLRNYDDPLAVRNKRNDIPDEVVRTLIEVTRNNRDIFHRFFKLKANWLGVEKLRRYDVYAPIQASDKFVPFDEAVQLVLESFNEFEPRISSLAQRVFTDNHYDSETRSGKMGGAFCSTLGPTHTPWVLQSYQGRPDDVATMAHELGHAVHSMLAEHHSILTQQSSLPLAETASTFGEMLLLDKLMATDPTPSVQQELLFSSMDDQFATVLRQIYFALFEIRAHEAIANGASVDDLCEIYLDVLREQFGDSIEIADEFKYEWVAVPHIYGTPFYVYAYAFGQLLALSLYQQYKTEGNGMVPRYVEILAAGGSEAPVEILKRVGFDVYSAEFWQSGFDVIRAQLEQLEALPIPVRA